MSKVKKWSPQQAAFIEWSQKGSGSCVLTAVAGAGKTTTIIEAARLIRGCSAILAFNKKIAVEIEEKLKEAGVDWKKAKAGTVHSFGFAAYRKSFPDVNVDDLKVSKILEDLCPQEHPLNPYAGIIGTLVGLAKQRALGVIGSISDDSQWHDIIEHFDLLDEEQFEGREVPVEALISLAKTVLTSSNRQTKTIDFNDMVYMPLVHPVRFFTYDNVFVDEAQDTNPARRALVRALVRRGGRVIAVGDPHQAIYGFTGADSDALDLIKSDFSAKSLPLSVSFRCPKRVVEFAQQWVSHIESAPTAIDGEVSSIHYVDLLARKSDLNETAAILCRNTKPLVETALTLIRMKVPCRVEGRDIGANLKKLATRWRIRELSVLVDKLDDYKEKQIARFAARKQEQKAQAIEDVVETIKVIADQCMKEGKRTVDDLVSYIDDLFADGVEKMLVLSTIHKAKGREWQTVFWLDRTGTLPSKWARQPWQVEQEHNLCYVAATRAQSRLIEVKK